MASPYSIALLDMAVAAESIVSLWARNLSFGSERAARAKLNSGYLANPAGCGLAIGLQVEDSDLRRLVGVIFLHERRMHWGRRVLAVTNLADYAVEPDHRTLGPALMLMKRAVKEARARVELVYGLPNRKSSAVCSRAGLRQLGALQRHVRVLSVRSYLARSLPALPAAALAALLDPVLAAAAWIRDRRYGDSLRFEPIDFDSPQVDAIWAARPHDLLLSERTSATLRWRFGHDHATPWQLCLARDRSGTPRGLVVWRLKDGMAEVGDFLCEQPVRGTASLLASFAHHARRAGAASVSTVFFGCPAVVRQMEFAGLRVRQTYEPVFTGPLDGDLATLGSPVHWFLTAFDNDAD